MGISKFIVKDCAYRIIIGVLLLFYAQLVV